MSLASAFVILMITGRAEAQQCYSSSILSPTPFMGNNNEIFKLADGSVWQVKYEYEYMYEYYPSVVICPGQGKLIIGKKTLTIQQVSGPSKQTTSPSTPTASAAEWKFVEETSLEGNISGTVKQGRIFKTVSGNVYEVTGLTLQLVLELQPKVTILRNGDTYKLIVAGFDEPLLCRKLNVDRQTTAPEGKAPAAVIESRIDGEFSGWNGETIFKLQNGQIWQQSSHAYKYVYKYSPEVVIYRSGSAYKMRVDGVEGEIQVKQLQ